jgi:pimeloyl-ACP methyl ester carboxylesterase
VKVFLSDGRALRYWSSATPGPIVLVFHGCPDTRRIAMTGRRAAEETGVRLLAFNRPGYGSSTPTASSHTSVARDAAELLDLWGIERVAVLGVSVGGPYAAAFAATYPDRATALGLVSAPGPTFTESEGTVEEAMERLRPEFMEWRARIDPDDEDDAALAARFLAELPEPDAALLREYDDEFIGYLAFEALVKPEGYLRDAALHLREWDFDPTAVRCPTTLWCGELDDKAMEGSSWWGQRVPQTDVEVLPATTHLAALLTQWPVILRRLVPGSRTTG